MKATIFFGLISFFFFSSYAQTNYSTNSKKAIKLYEESQRLMQQRKFPEAIEKLTSAVQKDNNFIEAHLRLAFSYELMREMKAQQFHLEQIIRIDSKNAKYKNVYYSLGKLYFNQGKYKLAEEMLTKLKSFGIDHDRIKKDVIVLEENIFFAIENMKNPLDIHPKPLPAILNSFPLQYFPVLTADENSIIYTTRDGVSFHDDENIVISEKDENGNWTKPISISPNINSQFNEGTCTITADGRTLIFTNCEGRQSVGGCDLYITFKTGNEWSEPKNLGRNINSRSWESQPALSADGRKLFFVSDRGGGFGKRDIWMTYKNHENNWEKAINLGHVINTKEDEVSPFIHVNGVSLFFASNGRPGFGGYDIYKSERRDGTWMDPSNLGYPVNTHEDQVSLFVSTNGKNGYYSNETKGPDNQNQSILYGFEFPSKGILEQRSIYLTGNIYDIETKEPLKAAIELYDLKLDKQIAVFTSDPVTGEYYSILNEESKIALYVDREGYLFESLSFEINPDSLFSITKDIFLKPIKKGSSVRLNNVFFEFNSASLSLDSKTELDRVVRFLTRNPETKIKISGHTDDEGTKAYNLILSEKRAKAVYDYLINCQIDPDNLTFIGYGESQPIATAEDDNADVLNRRIEFEVSN